MTAHAALAATLGLTTSELSEYRYQAHRHPHAVYSIGSAYYCARSSPPTAIPEIKWERLSDQFWAEKAGTICWVGKDAK